MQYISYFIITTLFLAIGCAPTIKENVQRLVQKDHLPSAQAISAAKNGKLTCAFEGECEPSVALISTANGDSIDRCSGFLISPTEVLTNDHCVGSIPNHKNACHGLTFIHFNGNVHRGCKNIRARSFEQGPDSIDYAIIELDQPITDRRAKVLARRGFLNDEKATIFRVQMTKDEKKIKYDGVQNKLECQASYQTVLDVNTASVKDPRMTFGECIIQQGNSGSPVLNSNGEVGAIIQSYLMIDPENMELFTPYLPLEGAGLVAVATQVMCMADVSPVTAKKCNGVKPFFTMNPKQYLTRYSRFSEPPQPWQAFSSNHSFEKNYAFTPSCVSETNLADGQDQFITKITSFQLGLSQRLQAQWRESSDGQNYSFNYLKFTGNNQRLAVYQQESFGTISVPVCERR